MRSSSRRRGRGGGKDVAERSGKGGYWILVNTIAAVLGVELYDGCKTGLLHILLWRFGIVKSMGLALYTLSEYLGRLQLVHV